MDRSEEARYFLDITPAFRHYHNHRLDPAYKGLYYMRLPDGRRVPVEKYEAELKAWKLAQFKNRTDRPEP